MRALALAALVGSIGCVAGCDSAPRELRSPGVELVNDSGATFAETFIPGNIATPHDAEILTAVGPGVYTQASDGSILFDDIAVHRLSDPTYTSGLNAQMVAVTKAKIARTKYVSITCVGDSITEGASAPSPQATADGYRKPINDALVAALGASIPVEWTGPHWDGHEPSEWHDGVGGRTTTTMATDVSLDLGQTTKWNPRQIYLIVCGTNDSRSSRTTAQFTTDYNTLVTNLHALNPSAAFVVSYVPENPLNAGTEVFVDGYNAALPGIWDSLVSSGLTIYRPAGPIGLLGSDINAGDQPHPTYATGYPKIGANLATPVQTAVSAVYP